MPRTQDAGLVDKRLGDAPCSDGPLLVFRVGERGDAQRRQAALRETQQLALAPQLEILLGQHEAVLRRDHGIEPGRDDLVVAIGVGDEDAVRAVGAAADPAAQLVQLGQPEAIGIEDEHHRRLGHVHADLDHRRAHDEIDLASAKPVHDLIALPGRHLSMDDADARRDIDGEGLGDRRQDKAEVGRRGLRRSAPPTLDPPPPAARRRRPVDRPRARPSSSG